MGELPAVVMPESWMPKDDESVFVEPAPAQEIGPSIGQNVLYVAGDGRTLAAAILTVLPDGVELQVVDPLSAQGRFRAAPVEHDASKNVGTWHYSEE